MTFAEAQAMINRAYKDQALTYEEHTVRLRQLNAVSHSKRRMATMVDDLKAYSDKVWVK